MAFAGFSRVLAPMAATALCAAVAFGDEDASFEVDVPEGESRTLTAAEVSEIGTRTLVKTGAGTLVAGEEMSAFAGDIRIHDGFYDATTTNAFGTTAGETYVDGGTILSRKRGTTGSVPAYGWEAFHLAGTGCQSNGVIRQMGSGDNSCFTRGAIALDGDILVTGGSFEFRGGTVAVNGHRIAVAMNGGNSFRFVATGVTGGWNDVDVLSGNFGLESAVDGGTGEHAITVESNAQFRVNNLLTPQYRRLTFRPGATFHQGAYCTKPAVLGTHNERNEWRGPIVLEGAHRLFMSAENGGGRVIDFAGFVSGPGGFMVKGANWLQLGCASNSFAGGVAAEGCVASDGWSVTGGVSIVGYDALPPAGGAVDLTNASFTVFSDVAKSNFFLRARADVPAVTVHGTGVLTAGVGFTSISVKSLSKTGAGPLTAFGAFHVEGRTDVSAGALRFGTSVPTTPAGLNWHYGTVCNWYDRQGVPSTLASRGVDATGAAFAYGKWMPIAGWKDGSDGYRQTHCYTGWIRVPGEEGETVKCNFVSSICRYSYLSIGGQVVVAMQDSTDTLTGTTFPGWKRFYVGPQVELESGWQPFHLYMANFHDGTSGPYYYKEFGWVADFGVGVDWEGRCATNSANYAKFLDPGDGSFLRHTMDYDKAAADPAQWRPTFGGPVAFAPGAVFDVNDAQPYTPVSVPALEGLPTIRNGAVKAESSTWTLRASDFLDADGRPRALPLTLEGDAHLAFPDGSVEIAFSEADAAELAAVGGKMDCPLIVAGSEGAVPANRFVLPAALHGKNWRVRRDGRALTLSHVTGLIVVFR